MLFSKRKEVPDDEDAVRFLIIILGYEFGIFRLKIVVVLLKVHNPDS